MTEALRAELVAELDKLPEANLRALLATLRQTSEPPLGRWNPAIGSMSPAEAAEMMAIIEEGCERVEPDEW